MTPGLGRRPFRRSPPRGRAPGGGLRGLSRPGVGLVGPGADGVEAGRALLGGGRGLVGQLHLLDAVTDAGGGRRRRSTDTSEAARASRMACGRSGTSCCWCSRRAGAGDGPGLADLVLCAASDAGDGHGLVGLLDGPTACRRLARGDHRSGVEGRACRRSRRGSAGPASGEADLVAVEDRGGCLLGLAAEVLWDERGAAGADPMRCAAARPSAPRRVGLRWGRCRWGLDLHVAVLALVGATSVEFMLLAFRWLG